MAAKSKAKRVKQPKTDEWLAKMSAVKRPTKKVADDALAGFEVVLRESANSSLNRRGLKTK